MTLGQMTADKVTKTKGMITHLCVHMDLSQSYIYQPKGINPQTGLPVDHILINPLRFVNPQTEVMDIPTELLGTKAEDIATGFKGTIICLTIHLNGCIHAEIKPEGVLKETKATIGTQELDIRRLKGDLLKPLAKKELKESIAKKPSPMPFVRKN